MKKILPFLAILYLPFLVHAGNKKKHGDDALNNKVIWDSSRFSPNGLNSLQIMNDNFSFCILAPGSNKKNAIVRYGFEKRTPLDTLFKPSYIGDLPNDFNIDDYKLSPTNKYVLLQSGTKAIFRHSRSARYYIYSAKVNKLKKIFNGEYVSDASFSPDENKVAFVYQNNLYIQYIRGDSVVKVTNDGVKNKIINGMADWVYEEEFALSHSYAWSPQGDKVAYYKFDESRVKEYQLTRYSADSIYPEQVKYKYPKAGEENSTVSIWVFHTNTHRNVKMEVYERNDQYIPRIKWTLNNNYIAVERLNRRQNYLELLAFNASTGQAKSMYSEQSATYIDINDDLYFFKDNSFIIKSAKGGYMQLYHYDKNGNLINKITQEPYEVVRLIDVDTMHNMLYYSANEPSPMLKVVYKCGIDGSNRKLLVEEQKGNNDAEFSKDFKYFIFTISRTLSPPVSRVYLNGGDSLYTLISNTNLKHAIAEMGFSPKEALIIKLSDSVVLNGWMMLPPDFKKSRKYPVLFYVYGGPGHNTVTDAWGGAYDFWFEYLASKGYIIVSVDNRGTEGRGEAFRKATYLKLGQLESDDQIAAARFIIGTYNFIDPTRIGIFGWSFGGYMAAECLMKGNNVFKMAVSVAPVTDWRYYDNIYTERYMQRPKDNPAGYKNTSVFEQVSKMNGKLLLVHGTFDDNVHPQNSMSLMDKMVQLNKPFDSEFFINKSHGISGGNTRLFLFNRITDFIFDNL